MTTENKGVQNNKDVKGFDIETTKLPRFEREVYLSLSDDATTRAAGEGKNMKVKFIIEEGWTVNDLVDRLLTITTSPRVAFQTMYRFKDKIAKEYVVPKAHARSVQTLSEADMIEKLAKQYGVTPDVMKAMLVQLKQKEQKEQK